MRMPYRYLFFKLNSEISISMILLLAGGLNIAKSLDTDIFRYRESVYGYSKPL